MKSCVLSTNSRGALSTRCGCCETGFSTLALGGDGNSDTFAIVEWNVETVQDAVDLRGWGDIIHGGHWLRNGEGVEVQTELKIV